ncbi:mitochondrial fission factor-like isoform X2 [Narcine bancroftii]|uniref:mitochondrial fission factor-like isoform X2 n=1 Tax=Narcine bancroftii TaxID=1343680 RepID=UPI003831B84B
MAEQAVSSDLLDSRPISCDLSFMETISQKMRIPNRLKVSEEPGDEERTEDIQLSTLNMQIPERISMGETEMQDIGARPYLYGWFQNHPLNTDPPPLSSSPHLMFGASQSMNVERSESPLQMNTSQNSSRSRTLSENEICLSNVARRQRNLNHHSNVPKLPFPSPGPGQALFSFYYVRDVLSYAGRKLFEHLMESLHQKMGSRNRFRNQPLSGSPHLDVPNQTRNQSMAPDYTIPEGVLENFSVMEIVTLRRQMLWRLY